MLGGTAAAVGLGGDGVITGAFTTVDASRSGNFSVASQENAVVGVANRGPVKKNSREAMLELANNRPEPTDITVSLDTCSDGTLYDNDGESGCSVVVSLESGNTQFVDIEAAVTGTIPFSISVNDPDFSFSTSGTVESESGNNPDAVRIQKPDGDNDFEKRKNKNEWEANFDIRDNDNDADLDRIEIEVLEGNSGGTVVATDTISIGPADSGRYKENKRRISPDDSNYSIKSGQLYTLSVKALDADGNTATDTVQDTA
jgi:hypothetical protein